MKRVKTLVDLHKAGANVEGLRFIEIKGKDLRAADLDEVLRKIAATSDTFEAALFASVKAIVESLGGQTITVAMPEEKHPHRWTFEIERDREGYLNRIVASCDEGH